MTLFDHQADSKLSREAPLAARMRPRSFDEFVGQEHIVGPGRVLRKSIEADQIPSIVLWGRYPQKVCKQSGGVPSL